MSSPNFNLSGVCPECDGDGELATTDRSCTHPEKYPQELVPCPACNGKGGTDPKAIKRSRELWKAYQEALSE